MFILSAPPIVDREILRENITKLELGLEVEGTIFKYKVGNGSLIGSRIDAENQIFWSYEKFLRNDFINAI